MLKRKTRKDLLDEKQSQAETFNLALATINFMFDVNLGFVIRTAACFGAKEVLVLGAIPSYRRFRQISAGTCNYVKVKQFSRPSELLNYSREQGYQNVALELAEGSQSIYQYQFPAKPICLFTGNETHGFPNEILFSSDLVHIPMPGSGICLNTSQALNIGVYEWHRQRLNNSI